MKAGDFRPCALCKKGVAHGGVPLFYRVTIESMGIDGQAAQQAHGMEQFFGGGTKPGQIAIARAFCDPDIGVPLGKPTVALVCQTCALEPSVLAVLQELAADQAREREPEHAA